MKLQATTLAIAALGSATARKALLEKMKSNAEGIRSLADNLGFPSIQAAVLALADAVEELEEVPGKDGAELEQLFDLKDLQSGNLNFEALMGYGCWCFFGNIDSALGRGPPVDGYDATCQKLSLCYRCIFVDAENEGDDDCDPFNTSFEATIDLAALMGGGGGVNNATVGCSTNNQENCAWRTCSCAMTMITSFFQLSFSSTDVYDDNLKHNAGFDYNLECPQQGRAQDRQCCGFYPDRRTYDHGEARDCCHDRTIYNPLRHVCCPDGTHLGLGHSC